MSRTAYVCLVAALLLLSAAFVRPSAQTERSIFEEIRIEHDAIENEHCLSSLQRDLYSQAVEFQAVDVKHYRLQLRLAMEQGSFSGMLTMNAEATAPVSSVNINAASNLAVDSVLLDGSPADFSRRSDRIEVRFPDTFPNARSFTVAIQYHSDFTGQISTGSGMTWARHGPSSVAVMASHSEPFGAPAWYPCIDNPADKATAEVEITVPDGFQAASNGKLLAVQANADHSSTYFWREDSPLATYLLAVYATNFVRIDDSYTALDGVTNMPLVYYLYPEHVQQASTKLAVTRPAIQIYANLFGEYPFLNEKYGVAEFPFSGAMEHQTITGVNAAFLGTSSSDGQATLVHELSHHWWGDLVTMKTWDDIWLNEGFATYSEVLFFERFANLNPGQLMSRSYDDGLVDGSMAGTVTAENLDRPFDDQGAIYRKGGWVLHMLRHVLGDQKFFDAMKQYRDTFAFSNASTADFQHVCESFYGSSLDWFFKQWVYAPARPIYRVSVDVTPSGSGSCDVSLLIKQKQTQEIPGRDNGAYIMPLDVTVHYADGSSDTRVVMNNSRKQRFNFAVSKQPTGVLLDEQHWVLMKVKGQ